MEGTICYVRCSPCLAGVCAYAKEAWVIVMIYNQHKWGVCVVKEKMSGCFTCFVMNIHEYRYVNWLINTLWIFTSFYVGSFISGNDDDSYRGILCLSCTKEDYACPGGRKMINVHADECELQEGPMYDVHPCHQDVKIWRYEDQRENGIIFTVMTLS